MTGAATTGAVSASVDRRLPVVPSVFRAGVTIAAVKMALLLWGFAGTVERLRRRMTGVPDMLADLPTVRAAEWSVAMAAALFPGRARCLEQSLALYYLLRRQGVPVKYCQGVRPYPFQAHAWIEYAGEVVNDVSEQAGYFTRLPDQLP